MVEIKTKHTQTENIIRSSPKSKSTLEFLREQNHKKNYGDLPRKSKFRDGKNTEFEEMEDSYNRKNNALKKAGVKLQ